MVQPCDSSSAVQALQNQVQEAVLLLYPYRTEQIQVFYQEVLLLHHCQNKMQVGCRQYQKDSEDILRSDNLC